MARIDLKQAASPDEAVAVVRTVVEAVSAPVADPLGGETGSELLSDLKVALRNYPDLFDLLDGPHVPAWISVAEKWRAAQPDA